MLEIVLLASAPALFWLWLFWRRDRWDREPKRTVLGLFALGAVAAAPAWWLERVLPGPPSAFYDNFVRVALTEELFKLLPVWVFAYRHRDFDEPMDGIVYMVASALGFATVENVLYTLHGGAHLLLYRAFTSTLAHVGFSGLLGYAVGRAKFLERGRAFLLLRAIVAVVALHGAYDLLLHYGSSQNAPEIVARGAVAVLVPVLLLLLYLATNLACRASPFRPK